MAVVNHEEFAFLLWMIVLIFCISIVHLYFERLSLIVAETGDVQGGKQV